MHFSFRNLLVAACCVCMNLAFGQSGPGNPTFNIQKASDIIKLDGVMDEQSWKDADVTAELIQQFPYDTSRSLVRTEFRATYNERFLYFSVVAYDNKKGGYAVSSLRRDFRGPGLDGVAVILDTFQDVTNAFFFGLSPAGVQREGLISNGYLLNDNLDLSWDNKWYSSVKMYEGYYISELAIPFTSIRFKEGSSRWNVKLYRQDSKENERATWPMTPRFFEPGNLNYHGEMIWDRPLGSPGSNISLIPYTAVNSSKDFLEGTDTQSKLSAGGDAKVAVSPSLNLDLTANPDFSQVEVDRQVTNLDRFEIFFPEKRQFFLENADLFSSYGHMLARPFFSRRIGVVEVNKETGVIVQNRILFGARLSGNINRLYRIGFLNMQTEKLDAYKVPSYNFTVATAQRRLGTNSNIRAIFVNRQTFKNDSGDFRLEGYRFNRVAGLDYNYSFKNNKYTGNLFFHKQFTSANPGREFAHGYSFLYNTQKLSLNWFHQIIGKNYDPAVGYVPRKGYKRFSPSGAFRWYPSNSIINNHGPALDFSWIYDDAYGLTDYQYAPMYLVNFQSQATLAFRYEHNFTYLFFDFDPTRSPDDDAVPLPAFTAYRYNLGSVVYTSDPKKLFTYALGALHGQYYDGKRTNLSASLNYRFQPYGVISLDANFNRIMQPAPYKSEDIYLISPRLDLTLTRTVFLTTFVQYNSQFENMNINTRLQWRFRPVSDLFIVYTDNYFYSFDQPDQNFSPKNRSLVIKLTYWLNL